MLRKRPSRYIYRARYRYDRYDHPDMGANDEGYHWTFCVSCSAEKEHERWRCLTCNTSNTGNAPKHSQR